MLTPDMNIYSENTPLVHVSAIVAGFTFGYEGYGLIGGIIGVYASMNIVGVMDTVTTNIIENEIKTNYTKHK